MGQSLVNPKSVTRLVISAVIAREKRCIQSLNIMRTHITHSIAASMPRVPVYARTPLHACQHTRLNGMHTQKSASAFSSS